MALASLASLMMSASSDCASGDSEHLPPQQAGHHFDAGQRILQLVRDARRHFAERGQPIAQPLAFLLLLDLRQVLEEHHRADRPRRRRPSPATACSRSRGRCPSAAVPRGWAASSSRRRRTARGRCPAVAKDSAERPADVVRLPRQRRKSGTPRRSSAPACRRGGSAITPLRMLLTMCRKKRSSGAGPCAADSAGRRGGGAGPTSAHARPGV